MNTDLFWSEPINTELNITGGLLLLLLLRDLLKSAEGSQMK